MNLEPMQYECAYLPCGVRFAYLRACLGERVPPKFCPQCGIPLLKPMEGN